MFFTSRGFSFFWDVVILNRNRTETTFLPVQRRKEIAMANMYRDVNLSEVNESYIGKELKVAGWVENIRDHGGVSFIDLRDMYGVLQVVLRDTTLLDGIHKEECIAIEGIMEQRDEETYNPKIPSGTIELEAKKITILGQVYQQLPFEVQTS